MLLPVLPVYALQLEGATPLLVGVAMGIYGFPQVLLQIPSGYLSDKAGRRPIMIAGLIIFSAGTLIAATSNTITGVIVGRFFQGAGAIASVTVAWLSDLISERLRARAMAIFGMSIGCSFCIAMILGPLLASSINGSAIFWFTLIFSMIALIIVIFYIPKPTHRLPTYQTSFRFRTLCSYLIQKPFLPLFTGIFVLHFTLVALFMILPSLLENKAHLPLKYHSWIYLGVMIISFFAMFPFIILSEKRNYIRQCFLGAICLLLLAITWLFYFHETLIMLLIGTLLYFIGFNFLEACVPATLSKMAPPTQRGTLLGIYSSCQFLGAGLGGVVAGLMMQHVGYQGVLFITLILLIVWLMMTFFTQHPKNHDNIVLTLHPNQTECNDKIMQHLNAIPGVQTVTLLSNKTTAYLKVNNTLLDKSQLNRFGCWHSYNIN